MHGPKTRAQKTNKNTVRARAALLTRCASCSPSAAPRRPQMLRPKVVFEMPPQTREELLVLRLLLDMTSMPASHCTWPPRLRFTPALL